MQPYLLSSFTFLHFHSMDLSLSWKLKALLIIHKLITIEPLLPELKSPYLQIASPTLFYRLSQGKMVVLEFRFSVVVYIPIGCRHRDGDLIYKNFLTCLFIYYYRSKDPSPDMIILSDEFLWKPTQTDLWSPLLKNYVSKRNKLKTRISLPYGVFLNW